jgi:hypothetical protein
MIHPLSDPHIPLTPAPLPQAGEGNPLPSPRVRGEGGRRPDEGRVRSTLTSLPPALTPSPSPASGRGELIALSPRAISLQTLADPTGSASSEATDGGETERAAAMPPVFWRVQKRKSPKTGLFCWAYFPCSAWKQSQKQGADQCGL